MKVYVIVEEEIDSTVIRCVVASSVVRDLILKADATLGFEEFDILDDVPPRKVVHVVAGEPGEEPRITEVLCWPWDPLLRRTIEPDVMDRRVDPGLIPDSFFEDLIERAFGVRGAKRSTLVVRCQDRDRALSTWKALA